MFALPITVICRLPVHTKESDYSVRGIGKKGSATLQSTQWIIKAACIINAHYNHVENSLHQYTFSNGSLNRRQHSSTSSIFYLLWEIPGTSDARAHKPSNIRVIPAYFG
jgi:hypothetical protein